MKTKKTLERIILFGYENNASKEDIVYYFISNDLNIVIYSNLETERIKLIDTFLGDIYSYSFNDFENDEELLEELQSYLNKFYKDSYIEKISNEYLEYTKKRGF